MSFVPRPRWPRPAKELSTRCYGLSPPCGQVTCPISWVRHDQGNVQVRLLSTTRDPKLMSRTAADTQEGPWFERRTRKRFRLVFPVIFHWSDGTEHSAMGYCRNIGLGGVFIVTSDCPPVGVEVEVDVVVPASDPAPTEILFRHTGRTIRIQACEDLLGFAVAGNFAQDDAIQKRVAAGAFGQQ